MTKETIGKPSLISLLAVTVLGFGGVHIERRSGRLNCLKEISSVRLPGRPLRFDYQTIDPERRMLFISHLGDNAVVVFNLRSGKVLKDISAIPEPHGILAVPKLSAVFVSATPVNELYKIDERGLKVTAKAPAGYFPDGIAYAPGTGRIFVSDEFGKTVSVINAKSMELITKIKVGGTVGNSHYDSASKAVFTTDGSRNELLKIDPTSLTIAERIPLPGCRGAHGFLIGHRPHFAYVTGEDNASLVVVDIARRKVIQKFSVGREPDVLAIDLGIGLLYVSSESGVVSVFKVGPRGLSRLCQGKLWPHAHTVSVDQATHRIYFPIQDWEGFPTLKVMIPHSLAAHESRSGSQ